MKNNRAISMRQLPRAQRGLSLLEGLISILIFSFGILGLVGLQAASIRNSADAKYRADATFLANQIIGYIWADRTPGPPATVNTAYAYGVNAGTAPTAVPCSAVGTKAAGIQNVTDWLDSIETFLPNAAANRNRQEISILGNVVTVTVCWQGPQDPTFRNVRLTSTIEYNVR